MDQQKVGNLIKQIRKDNNLTQAELANKLGVTYQAVSKWENGKNIPDIEILKLLKELYNIDLDSLLNGNYSKKKNYKILIPLSLIIILIIIIIIILLKSPNDFDVKHIDTSCDNFDISGIAAFNENKTSINIEGITYCGEDSNIIYSKISSGLYTKEKDNKTKLQDFTTIENITLQEYIKQLNLLTLEYSSACNLFKDNDIYVIITAYENNKTTEYEIPIHLKDDCLNSTSS